MNRTRASKRKLYHIISLLSIFSYFLFSDCPYLEVECLEELRAGPLGELRGPVARVDMLAQLLKGTVS